MKKDLVLTLITQFIVLLSGLLVFKIANQTLGSDGFALFALTKRNISFMLPAILLGFGIAIPRYVSLAIGRKSGDEDKYFLASALVLIVIVFIFGIVLVTFRDASALILFSDSSYSRLILPIYVSILGLVFHVLVYAYYRGKLNMVAANALQLLNFAVTPLVVLLFTKSVAQFFLYNGLLILAVSIATFIYIYVKINKDLNNIREYIREVITYGVQRVPGDFGLSALISLPALITTHRVGIQEGGYIAFGISLFNMFGQVFAPIGLVFLPKISQYIGSNQSEFIIRYIKRLFAIAISLGLFMVVLYELFAEKILGIYLGSVEPQMIIITKLIIIGSFAYVVYVAMRSVIDAYFDRAINTINILISLSIFILLAFGGLLLNINIGYQTIIIYFVVAIYILAILTTTTVMRVISIERRRLNLKKGNQND